MRVLSSPHIVEFFLFSSPPPHSLFLRLLLLLLEQEFTGKRETRRGGMQLIIIFILFFRCQPAFFEFFFFFHFQFLNVGERRGRKGPTTANGCYRCHNSQILNDIRCVSRSNSKSFQLFLDLLQRVLQFVSLQTSPSIAARSNEKYNFFVKRCDNGVNDCLNGLLLLLLSSYPWP